MAALCVKNQAAEDRTRVGFLAQSLGRQSQSPAELGKSETAAAGALIVLAGCTKRYSTIEVSNECRVTHTVINAC